MSIARKVWRQLFGIGSDGHFTKLEQRKMNEYRRKNGIRTFGNAADRWK